MSRRLLVLLLGTLASGCRFDSAGLPQPQDKHGPREAATIDGPLDVSGVDARDAQLTDTTPADGRDTSVLVDRVATEKSTDKPAVFDNPRPDAKAPADKAPADKALPDKALPDKTPPDKTPPDKTPPDKPKPDVSPCAACVGVVPICCDKGLGLKCYSDTLGCSCNTGTKSPCAGAYSVCCEPISGSAKCAATASGCRCDAAKPCSGAYSVCCDPGTGVATCASSSGGCVCATATGQPCAGGYSVCCNKGSGNRCFSDTSGCACNWSATNQPPCQGSSYPYCCKQGGSATCTATMHYCECNQSTGWPCTISNCTSCQNENGWTCHNCP